MGIVNDGLKLHQLAGAKVRPSPRCLKRAADLAHLLLSARLRAAVTSAAPNLKE